VTLVIRHARVVTLADGPRPRRGAALGTLGVLPDHDVLVHGPRIEGLYPGGHAPRAERELHAHGRALLPGFVDCHTHACWAGDRVGEWLLRLQGATYLEIQRAGGGIMATVRAVRATPEAELAALTRARLAQLAHLGTTTAEVKSGYGLDAATELRMLRAIAAAAHALPGTVVPTALLGHALDPDDPAFVERTVTDTLDAVHAAFPGIAVDAFCERGAWTLADTTRLLGRARALGHPVRVHADQFTALGMVDAAIALGARSADHLEASDRPTLERLAASATYGVVLPVAGFHLDDRYADARRFVDAGGALALATNWNPGSAPSPSMPFAIALAVRKCGLTPAEAIAAATVNAASLLGLDDRGTIAPGQRADLVLLRHQDERILAWALADDPVAAVVAGGRVVRQDD